MRLIIISNRLPFTISKSEGEFTFNPSSGGLASGLGTYLESLTNEYIWVGWPGTIEANKNEKKEIKKLILKKYNAYPIFIDEKYQETFYEGFCNDTIWPLFHYFPSYTNYIEQNWNDYKEVNNIFCQELLEILEPDDTIWVHDYHLMLLPGLLREKLPDTAVGFFLHIPFPSYEMFRLLPKEWAKEILKGLLGADLIGFHTYDYTQFFLHSVQRILGCEHNIGRIIYEDRVIKADTFPMGIDFHKFFTYTDNKKVKKEREKAKESISDYKVILSIDRLDYTKGIVNRLQGYYLFLKNNQEYLKKVILVMIVVPSRTGVEQYQIMKKQIDELVSTINSELGSIGWTPILYLYQAFSFYQLIALYSLCDICLVTPLRDGMNLVAKEYIACRNNQHGVLILSEMAGASRELGEAIIVNPNHKEEIAKALKSAVKMPEDEQITRLQTMQERIASYDVTRWGNDFIEQLLAIKKQQEKFKTKLLNYYMIQRILHKFSNSPKKIIFLDYDGTLVPFVVNPKMAIPDSELLSLISKISKLPNTEVVIISGRDKETLGKFFGDLDIGIIAEHGVWLKGKGEDWSMLKPLHSEWKKQLLPILKVYVDRLPGAFIEEKEFSLVWHFRKAEQELASQRSKELMDDLVGLTSNIDVQILQGNKVIEIRNSGVNKGIASMHWVSEKKYDFILAIGDDWTDEDLFQALPETAYTIKVGISSSYARFNLTSYIAVRSLLEEFNKVEACRIKATGAPGAK